MKLAGTKFQLKVWAYLRKIPRGSVKTYSQVAKAIGKPLAVRAVANAIGKNPYAPKIPCHKRLMEFEEAINFKNKLRKPRKSDVRA